MKYWISNRYLSEYSFDIDLTCYNENETDINSDIRI